MLDPSDEEDPDEDEEADSNGAMFVTTARGVDGGDEKTVVNESNC